MYIQKTYFYGTRLLLNVEKETQFIHQQSGGILLTLYLFFFRKSKLWTNSFATE